ncbi:hypothetical protein Cni_G28517 [Canna indica]|uniref:Uncharacterized protein n=1 Tax=Canna indica TaxID=4628 RepID=A0AAQ3L408_9LILI|nr:hypothetical protein Cni_G28517 [Canna indica]
MCGLKDELKKCIKNEKDTDAWNDPWIDTIPISLWPTFINVEALVKIVMVCELIDNDSWKNDMIETYFGKELVSKIENITISKERANDKWVLVFSRDGNLTTRRAYCELKGKE